MHGARRAIIGLTGLIAVVAVSCQPQPEIPTQAVLVTDTPPPTTTRAFATLPPPPPSPTPPPERDLAPRTEARQVAVTSATGAFDVPETFAPGNIYVLGLDGTRAQITTHPAQDTAPIWSADGQRIYFVSDRDGVPQIYTVNVTNQNPIQKVAQFDTEDQRQPSLSPGDIDIAFTSNRNGNDDIYIMSAGGRGITPLITDPAPDYDPNWSPDNTWMVFTSERDGNPELYLLNNDSSEIHRLTNHPGVDEEAAFSPDGRRIAFISDRNGFPQVFLINLPTQRLTFDEARAQEPLDVLAGIIPPLELDTDALPPTVLPLTSDPTPKETPGWMLGSEGGFRIVYVAVQEGVAGTRRQPFIMNDDGSGIDLIGDINTSYTAPAPRPQNLRAR